MLPPELADWYAARVRHFERTYLEHEDPWAQSGYFGEQVWWERLRRPIADCVDTGGRFLDIGCANGYLLECIREWTAERGLEIEPWGLDISPRLIDLARARLPAHAPRMAVGDGLSWSPPVRFDYVRTGVHYVPRSYERRYLARLRQAYLAPGGRLLCAEYRDESSPDRLTVNRRVEELGFAVESVRTAVDASGREGIRIAVVRG